MWFECAKSNDDVAISGNSITEWLNEVSSNSVLKKSVYHRYNITKGRTSNFMNWSKKCWFFQNFSLEQLQQLHNLIFIK